MKRLVCSTAAFAALLSLLTAQDDQDAPTSDIPTSTVYAAGDVSSVECDCRSGSLTLVIGDERFRFIPGSVVVGNHIRSDSGPNARSARVLECLAIQQGIRSADSIRISVSPDENRTPKTALSLHLISSSPPQPRDSDADGEDRRRRVILPPSGP